MKYLFAFLAAIFFMQPSMAVTQEAAVAQNYKPVHISGAAMKLPPIDGFQEVYGRSPEFDALIEQFVPASNRLLAVYISDEDLAEMDNDAASGFKKYILVQTLRQDLRVQSDAEFGAFRDEFFKQLRDSSTFKDPRIGETFDKASAYLEKNYDSKTAISIGEVRNLGIVTDEINQVGMMLLSDYGLQTESGVENYPVAASTIAMNLSNRIVFLYAYYSDFETQADIDFIKKVSLQLAQETLSANGLVADKTQYTDVIVKGINMNSTLRSALIGGVVGGIVAGIGAYMRRRKNNDKAV